MKILLSTLSISFLAMVLYFVFSLDSWMGVLAYWKYYLVIAFLVAVVMAAGWSTRSKKLGIISGVTAFSLLMMPLLIKEPSSRILRRLLIDVKPGMSSHEVVEMVQRSYIGSGYAMPRITEEPRRLHVSLLTQKRGDCTAAIFRLESGVVMSSYFSAD